MRNLGSASASKRPIFRRGQRRRFILPLAAFALLLAWFGVTLFLLSGLSGGDISDIDATSSVRGAIVDPPQPSTNQWHAAGNRSSDPGGDRQRKKNSPEGTPSSHTQPQIEIQIEIQRKGLNADIVKAIQQTAELPSFPINHRSGEKRPPLSDQAISQCHKALWHTLDTTTYVLPNNETFVITGDIRDLWLRDSAAQIHPLLVPSVYNGQSLVQYDRKLERVVSGLILKTARYIRFDPYANAFKLHGNTQYNYFERTALGRHGFISTWNYELDSGCYFMRMLYFFHTNFPLHPILREKEVKEAVMIMVDVWIAEQRHEDDMYPTGRLFDCVHCNKPYRYNPKELSRGGKGSITNSSAGLTWSGFRPSDDPCKYGYLIPSNMFATVSLTYMMDLATNVWIDEPLSKKCRKLRDEIEAGIQRHGVVEHKKYGKIYAYEVDGLGKSLLMDDANVPSLLSIPYLGYKYDEQVYANTLKFILSRSDPYYHVGHSNRMEFSGIGSPHTSHIPNSIWPMAMIMEGLVSRNVTQKIHIVNQVLASSGSGWMHESFDPNNPKRFSRPWFCWPDSLFAELVMSLTDKCPQPSVGQYSIMKWSAEYAMNGTDFEKPASRMLNVKRPPQNPSKSKLVVMSVCVPGKRFSREYIHASLSNKRKFCNVWDAQCVLATELQGSDRKTYSAKWEKLHQINEMLHSDHDFDWIMWMDCDAVFTNIRIDWRKHLSPYLDDSKVLVASKDKNGINLGVLFVPHTREATRFIEEMYEMRHYIESHPNEKDWKDQAALNEMLAKDETLKNRISTDVPQGKINSFLDNPDGTRWSVGDWVAHQVWCQKDKNTKCDVNFISAARSIL